MVRPLALLECWLIKGGKDSIFGTLQQAYIAHSILPSTAPAIQLFLVQLTLGLLGLSSVGDNRTGSESHVYLKCIPM